MIRSILLLLVVAWPVSANDLFLTQLQLDQLGTVAAFDQGRVKSLDSLAASVMNRITGAFSYTHLRSHETREERV